MSYQGHHFEPQGQAGIAALLHRPDLTDEAVLDALRQRLARSGRDASAAGAVLAAARRGEANAVSSLRSVALPAPVARLTMPVQKLTRSPRAALNVGFWRLTSDRG